MASTFICPKGHSSTDNDFCSECGSKIQGTPNVATAANDTAATGDICPDCNAPVPAAGVNFCEICGYNFKTRTSGQFPAPAVRPAPPPVAPAPEPQPVANGFQVIVTVDPTLRTPDSPEAPANVAPITFTLDKPANLIGRTSQARAVFPEIPLDADSAVSHRHGLISTTGEGGLIFRDLSSSNGTKLNAAEVTPLVDLPLKAGDQLTLGHWTRITVEQIT